MVCLLTVRRHCGQAHATRCRPITQMQFVVFPDLPAARLHPLPLLELAVQERRKNVGYDVARPDIHPRILVNLPTEELTAVRPFLSQNLGPLDEGRVVDEQRTTLTAREVLRLMEALRRQGAERAERPATIAAKQSVRVVLNHRKAMLLREGHELVHLAADAGVVDRNDRSGPRSDVAFDEGL